MRRRDLIKRACGAALTSFLPVDAQEKAPVSWSAWIAGIEERIPPLLEETSVPGLSAVIIQDAKVRWRRAFGLRDRATRKPVDTETVFAAASMSKPVFAYAVMKLAEKGVLNLDTPLTKYTTERFLAGDPRLDLITARHVLCHTAGFQDWRSASDPLRIHFTPGTKYSYSGEGYSYLQSVVTKLTGREDGNVCATYEASLKVCATDIADYLKANILGPFGMNSSSYVLNANLAANIARPHDRNGVPIPAGKGTATDAARYAAAGGLMTTPTDYAKFLIEVINPRPSDSFRLTKSTRDEMIRPQVMVSSEPDYSIWWALGWRIDTVGIKADISSPVPVAPRVVTCRSRMAHLD
jgi:CubicO group peptidase (beta-lactamase class C family)